MFLLKLDSNGVYHLKSVGARYRDGESHDAFINGTSLPDLAALMDEEKQIQGDRDRVIAAPAAPAIAFVAAAAAPRSAPRTWGPVGSGLEQCKYAPNHGGHSVSQCKVTPSPAASTVPGKSTAGRVAAQAAPSHSANAPTKAPTGRTCDLCDAPGHFVRQCPFLEASRSRCSGGFANLAAEANAAASAGADSDDGTAFHAHAFVVRAFSRSSFIGVDSMANRHIFNDLDVFLPQTLKALPLLAAQSPA